MSEYDELHASIVGPDWAGQMVRDVLRDNLQMSRKIVRKLVEGQGVLVNGRHVWLSWRLAEGDALCLRLPAEESEDILAEEIPFDTVYEDEDVLVVNKPAGLIVHPTHGHWTGTLANGVVWSWQQRGIVARFRPVHRIDQYTSGLLVIAKNHYALKLLAEQMKARTIRRTYAAVVHGVPPAEGHVHAPIGLSDSDRRIRVVRAEGQEAITDYRVIEPFGSRGAQVELRLQTGRTHQIRVHMQHLGHPLFGDAMYGTGTDDAWITRQALHAQELGFVHPRTGDAMHFQLPLPADMRQLVERLRLR